MTTLAPNGFAARIVLAILAAVGILYANFGPLIVSGLAHRGFTSANAGYLLSTNLYGTALGGMLIVFVIRRVPWRAAAAALLITVLATDVWSIYVSDPHTLHTARFLHGIAGGASMGVFGSVIARTTSPERAGRSADDSTRARRGPWMAIALGCAALFAYQAGQMATFAYVIEFGERHELTAEFIGRAVAIGLWVGAPAAAFVAWWSTRSGRLRPAAIGALLTSAGVALFFLPGELAYLVANTGLAISFSLTIPYLLGVVAEMDNSGQMAALGGFINSLGLATGPAIAATILGENHYERVVLFAVIALAATAFIVAAPARLLDARARHGRVEW
jgi:predicted MFS family arabinose efflux permease